jgi:hypothetical protein
MNESENNQNQQSGEGGLFSDDYETPKRENPYLKKNREKSRAEAADKPEKPKREKKERVKASAPAVPPADGEENPLPRMETDVTANDRGDAPNAFRRKRTFSDWMFEHVKLIAAIATVLVLLSLVLITDVVDIVEDLITQSQQAEREAVTLTYVKGLSEKASPVTWSDLERFRRDESKANGTITWMLSVKGTSYEVWISGVSTAKSPTYVYLFDLNTGDRMILGEDDFDAFIEAHTK